MIAVYKGSKVDSPHLDSLGAIAGFRNEEAMLGRDGGLPRCQLIAKLEGQELGHATFRRHLDDGSKGMSG